MEVAPLLTRHASSDGTAGGRRNMARPSLRPKQGQRKLVKRLSALGLPQKQICAWVGMRSPKTLRKHFHEELKQRATAEVVELRTAYETGPSGRCLSITVVLGVSARGSEARNNSAGRSRFAPLQPPPPTPAHPCSTRQTTGTAGCIATAPLVAVPYRV